MGPPPAELFDRLCFVIHKACVEMERFIQEGQHEQAVDLADAVEHIPCYLPSWKDEFLPLIVDSFRRYQEKYNNKVFNYLGVLLNELSAYPYEPGRWRGSE